MGVQIHHHDVSGRFGIDHMKPNDKESIVGVPNNFLVFGPSGAGKSSLIGSLLSNDLDDGKATHDVVFSAIGMNLVEEMWVKVAVLVDSGWRRIMESR